MGSCLWYKSSHLTPESDLSLIPPNARIISIPLRNPSPALSPGFRFSLPFTRSASTATRSQSSSTVCKTTPSTCEGTDVQTDESVVRTFTPRSRYGEDCDSALVSSLEQRRERESSSACLSCCHYITDRSIMSDTDRLLTLLIKHKCNVPQIAARIQRVLKV